MFISKKQTYDIGEKVLVETDFLGNKHPLITVEAEVREYDGIQFCRRVGDGLESYVVVTTRSYAKGKIPRGQRLFVYLDRIASIEKKK